MSEIKGPERQAAARRAQLFVIATKFCIAVQLLIYAAVIVHIVQHADPTGDGMEWVGVMPGAVLLALGAAPAWTLSNLGRLLPLALVLAIAGVAIQAAYLLEVTRELAH